MQQFRSQQPTDLAGFSKYYWLEADYLEQEVVPAFHRNGFLEAKQFFAIVEWKVPRFGKTKLAYLTDEDI